VQQALGAITKSNVSPKGKMTLSQALEALRHPKASFEQNLKAEPF
jgi:hypothetical protein